MKIMKRILCIFLAVVLLFFSVNNSYFSPHKMDKVEAASIVVGGTVITADLIVKLVAALAVAGLAVGIIVEWSEMDIEALAIDVHDWCREHYDNISGYLEAQPALKEWILSDTWVVVVDTGGGSSPEPSPSPGNEVENPPATDTNETGLTQEQFEALLNENHGFSKAFKIVAGGTAAGITLSSILAPLSYIEEYNHYVDANGNVVSSDDPRIASVAISPEINAVAQAYMQDRIKNFSSGIVGNDPFSRALQSRFQPALIELPEGYAAWSEAQIVKWNCENLAYMSNIVRFKWQQSTNETRIRELVFSEPVYIIPFIGLDGSHNFVIYHYEPVIYSDNIYINDIYQTGSNFSRDVNASGYGALRVTCYSYQDYLSSSSQIPFYQAEGIDPSPSKIGLGLPQDALRHPLYKNYIDTDDDYGWASTANISPNDLAAAMPDIAGNLNGRYVSLAGVVAAINALKNQLEEKNPNVGVDTPVPYPNVDDYVETVKDVITDPEVFPQTDAAVDPEPDIGSAPDTETMKDYSGLLGLNIGILQNILQAIKDLLSWFVIDFPAIKAHILEALEDIPGLKGYEDFLAIVDYAKTQITDSYEYPVITIECPEILKPYWKQDVIVLLDFEDYAKYFLWVRMAMSFALLFGFVLWLFKDIKVQFSVS